VIYDLIVIGGGPGGLTAAKVAAQSGLKVLLIERKKNLAVVNRLCGQFTNIKMTSITGKYKYGYSEPLNLEIGTRETIVHFPAIGYSIEYKGPLKSYNNYVYFSPSGHKVFREKDHVFAFFWEKESLLAGLRSDAENCGVQIMEGTVALGAVNTKEGVEIRVDDGNEQVSYTARKAIAADGHNSRIAASLRGQRSADLNNGGGKSIGYVLEGVTSEYANGCWVSFTIPSLSPIANLWMYQLAGDRNMLGATTRFDQSPGDMVDKLMKLPYFESWFHNARVVNRIGCNSGEFRMPLMEPVIGNVLILGEAADAIETTNPGAIACGYMAARSLLKELGGQNGGLEYINWWQQAFEGNMPDYLKSFKSNFSLNKVCTDADIDYLYQVIGGQIGVPSILIAQNMEKIKAGNPQLFGELSSLVSSDVSGIKSKPL
jgi:flavin-dependent dehydrogenase